MLHAGMPRIETETIAQRLDSRRSLGRRVLLGDDEASHRHRDAHLLVPLHRGPLDRHLCGHRAKLHLELEADIAAPKTSPQILAKVVGTRMPPVHGSIRAERTVTCTAAGGERVL